MCIEPIKWDFWLLEIKTVVCKKSSTTGCTYVITEFACTCMCISSCDKSWNLSAYFFFFCKYIDFPSYSKCVGYVTLSLTEQAPKLTGNIKWLGIVLCTGVCVCISVHAVLCVCVLHCVYVGIAQLYCMRTNFRDIIFLVLAVNL